MVDDLGAMLGSCLPAWMDSTDMVDRSSQARTSAGSRRAGSAGSAAWSSENSE